MRLLRGMAGFLLLALCAPAGAQTNSTRPQVANRWLLIVETSRSMAPRAESAGQIAAMLSGSGMKGQMRAGDTLGLWTFNEKLFTGQFPLREWSPAVARNVADEVYRFLKSRKFEKEGRLEKVLPAMGQLIKDSRFITIVLITDGREKFTGTPFDSRINQSYQTWRNEQEKAQMPFLTVLRAENGQVTSALVNTPPWPLDMPPLPAELPATAPPQALQRPSPPSVPPLIIHGRKPETNAGANGSIVKESAATSQVPVSGVQGSNAAPSGAPISELRSNTPASPAPSGTEIASRVPPAPVPAAEAEKPAVAESSRPGPLESNAPGQPPASALLDPSVASVTDAAAGPQVAASLPSARPHSRGKIWLAATAFAVAAIGWVIWLARRSRPSNHASLITRSLDHKK